jgi:hypothetical protein
MRFKKPVTLQEFRGEHRKWSAFETFVVIAFLAAWVLAFAGCGDVGLAQNDSGASVDTPVSRSDGGTEDYSDGLKAVETHSVDTGALSVVTIDGMCRYNNDVQEGARCPGPVYSGSKICVMCTLRSTGAPVARCEWMYDVCVQDCSICTKDPS